jgi:hypothetical protein
MDNTSQSTIWQGLGAIFLVSGFLVSPAFAIDVDLTLEQGKHLMALAREPMEKASSNDDMFKIIKLADKTSRIGDDPETTPCGSSAIVQTKTYWFEYFGREEGRRSKVAQKEVRMPEAKVQAILNMPNLAIEIGLCGQEEFFAEGADVALQQGLKNIMPTDKGKPSRGRKIPGSEMDFVSRFSARFSYQDFDPQAPSKVVITLQDAVGTLISIDADFSKIK